ncbi:MAG: YfiR family protein [Bdellovibrionales bacterium]|nr:YfiR family protein [Bdellovibrionales bacterium]
MRLIAAGLGILISAAAPIAALASDQVADLLSVRAAYVANFAHYVEWPSDAATEEGAFRFCVRQDEEFGGALRRMIVDKPVGNLSAEVRVVNGRLEEWVGCRILVLPELNAGGKAALKALEARPVLTVAWTKADGAQAASIHLFLEQEHMRFEIRKGQLDRKGLKVSSKLLRLARVVE